MSGDPQAAARISAQLPEVPQNLQLRDQQALEYAQRVASIFPSLAPALGVVNRVAGCAIAYGVVGAKAYITPDLRAAGVMMVLSRHQLQQLPQLALQCFVRGVLGGGTTAEGFSPCTRQYWYDSAVNGVADRYFVFVGATNTASCDALQSAHAAYGPRPFAP